MKLLIVPARTGLQWVQQGIRTFRQQPLALAALFFLSMAAMSLVTVLPLIGPVIALGLLPATSLAMMWRRPRHRTGVRPRRPCCWWPFAPGASA